MHESDIFVTGIRDDGFDVGIVELAQSHIERRRLGLDGCREGGAHSKKGCRDANETHLSGVRVPLLGTWYRQSESRRGLMVKS